MAPLNDDATKDDKPLVPDRVAWIVLAVLELGWWVFVFVAIAGHYAGG